MKPSERVQELIDYLDSANITLAELINNPQIHETTLEYLDYQVAIKKTLSLETVKEAIKAALTLKSTEVVIRLLKCTSFDFSAQLNAALFNTISAMPYGTRNEYLRATCERWFWIGKEFSYQVHPNAGRMGYGKPGDKDVEEKYQLYETNRKSNLKFALELLEIPGIDVNYTDSDSYEHHSLLSLSRKLNVSEVFYRLLQSPLIKVNPTYFLSAIKSANLKMITALQAVPTLDLNDLTKEEILNALVKMTNDLIHREENNVITILKQAIDPRTKIGARFWKKEGFFACSLKDGTLGKICKLLKELDPTFNPLTEVRPRFFAGERQEQTDREIEKMTPFLIDPNTVNYAL